jgi:hypothetical protein
MLPYLPTALQVLMHVTADCQDMCDVVALLNQLMLRFKTALQDLLKEVMSCSTSHSASNACLAAAGTDTSCECCAVLYQSQAMQKLLRCCPRKLLQYMTA